MWPWSKKDVSNQNGGLRETLFGDMSLALNQAPTGALFCGVLAAVVLTGANAEGRRLAPKEVAPVIADGVRYSVPHFGSLRGVAQNGGYVEAEDVKTGKLIWSRMIYRIEYDSKIEKDVQDVFITNIEVKQGRVWVKTERAEEFELDLASGRVRALTALGPHIQVPSIVEDARKSWTWIATALSSSGYVADFTPASLWEIDRCFDEQTHGGRARPGGLFSNHLGSRLFAIGAYIGEVIRRARGGDWVGNDNDPEAELNIEVHLTDGTIFWPVQRAMKRFKNGPEDGIAGYGAGMGLKVGSRPGRSVGR
jgi:hypothetical protein